MVSLVYKTCRRPLGACYNISNNDFVDLFIHQSDAEQPTGGAESKHSISVRSLGPNSSAINRLNETRPKGEIRL